GSFCEQSLFPDTPTASQMILKHRVESILEDAQVVHPVIGPPCEWGNLFSMLRISHFKVRTQQLVQTNQPASSWAVSYESQKLRMINFQKQRFEDFSFPEEPQDE